MKVSFQGEHGAYSEEAIFQHWGYDIKTIPKTYLLDVFKTVESSEADLGLVPVENTIQGSIVQTFDLLNERGLKAQGETVFRVIHCLISNPETKHEYLKRVYSHPQALAQSSLFINKHKLQPISTYDTAGSVRMIRDEKILDAAAIASERAAQVYGMKILEKGIESNKMNYTRFLVIGYDEPEPTGFDKTSIAFIVENKPGSLLKAISALSSHDLNLSKIESRPLVGMPFEYIFFIDFEGHKDNEDAKEALKELKEVSHYLKVLGSYPRFR